MNRRYVNALFAAGLLLPAAASEPAVAADGTYRELLDALRDRGVIDRRQYDDLVDTLDEADDGSEIEIEIGSGGGLEIESGDDAFAFVLGGRLMVDLANYAEDAVDLGNGTELRQARLAVEGVLYTVWDYELGVDFADGDADVKDAYLGYEGFDLARLQIGQFKEPFSLEEQTGSAATTFMERALATALAPGRRIGIGLSTDSADWTLAGGLFGGAFDDDVDDEGDEGWGIAARVTWAPWGEGRKALHLGAAWSTRSPDDEREVEFAAGPESSLTDVDYLDTDDIDDVDRIDRYGLEAAVVHGPWSLQAEWIEARVDRRGGLGELAFDGYYVFASWFVTGESREYRADSGRFGGIEPRGDAGAWELALRFSELDLTDDDVTGGSAEQVTLGLNWYANPQVRFMFNYLRVDNDDDADADGDVAADDDPEILQFRAQIEF